MKTIDIVGQRFGRLTVRSRAKSDSRGKAMWSCVCDCGEHSTVGGTALRCGRIQSCGCLQREKAQQPKTHGYATGGVHPLIRVLSGMVYRCHNPKSRAFPRYGGRGIVVCEEWKRKPVLFVRWALSNGWKPGLTIDRRNNDGNYEPTNCRFVSRQENNDNRSPSSEWRRDGYRSGSMNAKKTHCPKGHEFDGVRQKTRGGLERFCRTCVRENSRESKRRRRQRLNSVLDK